MIAAHCDSSIRPPSFRSRWAGYCWVGWIGIMLIWPCLFARISVRSQSVCCWSIKNLWFQRQKDDLSQISKSGIWPRYPVVPPLLLSCSMLFYCSSLPCVSCLAAVVVGLRSWGPVFIVWYWYLSWSAARIYTERTSSGRLFSTIFTTLVFVTMNNNPSSELIPCLIWKRFTFTLPPSRTTDREFEVWMVVSEIEL